MISVIVNRTCHCTAECAWNLLSDFGNLSWVPGMGEVTAEGQGVGMIRKIALKGLPPAVESLDSIDHQTMRFSYSIISGNPLPVEGLRGSVLIVPEGDSACVIEWQALADSATIPEADAIKLLTKFYEQTLEMVDRRLSAG